MSEGRGVPPNDGAQPWTQAYEPPRAPGPSRPRNKLLVGCLVALGALVLVCVVSGVLATLRVRRLVVATIQGQADAIERHDPTAACSFNAPTLRYAEPCADYVERVRTMAPYFPGSHITIDTLHTSGGGAFGVIVRVRAVGPHGDGLLWFGLEPSPGGFRIAEVHR